MHTSNAQEFLFLNFFFSIFQCSQSFHMVQGGKHTPSSLFKICHGNQLQIRTLHLSKKQNVQYTWLALWFTSFLNFSAWEHFSLLWQTWARFCSDWTNPIKPLSVILAHQLSLSECRLIRELVIADNPMSVTWMQELRSSSWRLKRTLEICDINPSDRELQPFSTRVFRGMSWFLPCKIRRQYKKNKTETLTFTILGRCYKLQ